MGISIKLLLERYFTVPDLQDALDWIGEPVSGTKVTLIDRIVSTWRSHNRNLVDLLDILYPDQLRLVCQDYNLDTKGGKSVLIKRIINSNLVDDFEYKKPRGRIYDQPTGEPMQKMIRNEREVDNPIDLIVKNRKWIAIIVSAIVAGTTIAANSVNIAAALSSLAKEAEAPSPPDVRMGVYSNTLHVPTNEEKQELLFYRDSNLDVIYKNLTLVIDNGDTQATNVHFNLEHDPGNGWFDYSSRGTQEGVIIDQKSNEAYLATFTKQKEIIVTYNIAVIPSQYTEVKNAMRHDQYPAISFQLKYDGLGDPKVITYDVKLCPEFC